MVKAMPVHQLEAYPQMLLACLAALNTSSVHVFGLLLELLCEVCLCPDHLALTLPSASAAGHHTFWSLHMGSSKEGQHWCTTNLLH